jgi:hypothetical protein
MAVYDYHDEIVHTCHSVGIDGGCGNDCPVFLSGLCENVDEDMLEDIIEYFKCDEGLADEVLDLYGFDYETIMVEKKLEKLGL